MVVDYVRQGPRLARDIVLELFLDGRFHSAYELERRQGLKPGDWVAAMRELIEYGYSFGRKSSSFIIRKRSSIEPKQTLAELLRGVDATRDEDANVTAAVEEAESRVGERRRELEDALRGVGPPSSDEIAEAFPEPERDTRVDEGDFEPSSDQVPPPTANNRIVISVNPKDLVLPAREMVTMTFAVLAKKGSGKTYLAMVLAEEMLLARRYGLQLPFVVIDPTGVWYGLRAWANSDPSSFSILTVGGPNGDFSIEPEDGRKVANVVQAVWPEPIIIDLSDMLPESQHLFVADFVGRMYEVNKRAVHIFIDEADEFAPQFPDPAYRHQKRCFAIVDRAVRRGRVKGLGVTLVTLRSAVIHKNVLSQVDGLFVLNMAAPSDLEAVDGWMRNVVPTSDRGMCLRELPKLGQGDAFFMQTGKNHRFVRFHVRPKETFDSSYTPEIDGPPRPTPCLSHPSERAVEEAAKILGYEIPAPDQVDEVEP